MESYYAINTSQSLYHHGVKGMRWGRRRWQNEDGSLTVPGKIHYGKKLARKGYEYDHEQTKAIQSMDPKHADSTYVMTKRSNSHEYSINLDTTPHNVKKIMKEQKRKIKLDNKVSRIAKKETLRKIASTSINDSKISKNNKRFINQHLQNARNQQMDQFNRQTTEFVRHSIEQDLLFQQQSLYDHHLSMMTNNQMWMHNMY